MAQGLENKPLPEIVEWIQNHYVFTLKTNTCQLTLCVHQSIQNLEQQKTSVGEFYFSSGPV